MLATRDSEELLMREIKEEMRVIPQEWKRRRHLRQYNATVLDPCQDHYILEADVLLKK